MATDRKRVAARATGGIGSIAIDTVVAAPPGLLSLLDLPRTVSSHAFARN